MKSFPFSLKFFFVSLIFFSAHTYSNIPEMYRIIAEENNVPPEWFFSMVMVESKRHVSLRGVKYVLPWPWTINHRGKGYYFESQKKAYDFVDVLIAKGDYNFDIGIAQMNWKWHRSRFTDHLEALDPYRNLSESAKYLRQQYEKPECNRWHLAVGCYHRSAQSPKDKKIAKSYSKKVMAILNGII